MLTKWFEKWLCEIVEHLWCLLGESGVLWCVLVWSWFGSGVFLVGCNRWAPGAVGRA